MSNWQKLINNLQIFQPIKSQTASFMTSFIIIIIIIISRLQMVNMHNTTRLACAQKLTDYQLGQLHGLHKFNEAQ